MELGTGPASRSRSREPLPDDLQRALRHLVEQLGERPASERLGLSPTTVARALAGLGVNRGTVALIRAALVHQ